MPSTGAQADGSARERARGTPLLVVLLLIAAGLAPQAMAESLDERELSIRGALVYSFAKFVAWPDGGPAQRKQPLVFGLIGDERFETLFVEKTRGLQVNGRPVRVQPLSSADGVTDCDVIVISGAGGAATRRILDAVSGAPVLTVGSHSDFIESGGMINLFVQDGRLRFEVNLIASKRARLTLDARLLRAAARVQMAPASGERK